MISLRSRLIPFLVVMLGVLGVGADGSIATPTTSPAPAPIEQPATEPSQVSQKLLGQWLTKEPLGGEMVMFVFAPDGQAFLISGQSPQGNALARPIQYRINTTINPMQIDLILGQNTIVQTIFEFLPEGDLRLQMVGTAPGNTRPSSFSDAATTFLKISDTTTLPPKTELIQTSP